MGLVNMISRLFSKNKSISVSGDWSESLDVQDMYVEACYRDMAFGTCVDLLGKAISKCEFKFYKNGAEEKGPDWYRFNIEPNKNQNSSAFLQKLISKLYYDGECLVIGENDQLLVADDFDRTHYVLYEDIFERVTVQDFVFDKKFKGSEVFYWNVNSLGDEKSPRRVLEAVARSYAKLLSYSMKSFQTSRGNKGIFEYDSISLPPGQEVNAENQNNWLKAKYEKFGKFLSADNAIVAVGKGEKLTSYDKKSTYSNESTRDIRHLIDDISDFTAKTLGIPPALLRGDVQGIDEVMDQFLTFAIDPLADMIREEIVRKSLGYKALQVGYDMKIDTRQIRHVDIIDKSEKLEKLISSGYYSINDLKALLGEQKIDADWANEHHMTKNFANIEELLKGGEDI